MTDMKAIRVRLEWHHPGSAAKKDISDLLAFAEEVLADSGCQTIEEWRAMKADVKELAERPS